MFLMWKKIKRGCIEELKGLIVGRCIIVGYLNIKLSFRWEKARVMEMMREKGLLDVWRYENPEKREFTRRQMKEGKLKE